MNLSFDFANDNTKTGFRLHKAEVLNWGTFNQKVWQIKPGGKNALLTGDIGSGKSTLVDAITTLLVPHQKIVYNKAAGAESKERNIYSYLRGEYKNEKDETTSTSKAIYLRQEDAYSVILAYFYNEGYSQHITLAQVFWLKNNKPEKFFIVAGNELSIKQEFSNFGTEILKLKKRLKESNGIEVFDNFSDYAGKFRQIFGIKQPEALDLFYQTVSMKSVGNLTDFVRTQMLGKTNIKNQIDDLTKNFNDLTEAYKAVLKSRDQIEILQPLMGEIEQYEKVEFEIEGLKNCLDDIPKYFAKEKVYLVQEELQKINTDHSRLSNKIVELGAELTDLRVQEKDLNRAIESSIPGKRLKEIDDIILHKENLIYGNKDQNRRGIKDDADDYLALASAIGVPDIIEEKVFYDSISKAETKQKSLKDELTSLQELRDNKIIQKSNLAIRSSEIIDELASLKQRNSQIPERNLRIRQSILNDLELNEEDLPFVGELIRVNDNEKDWEGAIERRLHSFGLSLLVSENLYSRISRYVNNTNLKGQLVYFRVTDPAFRKRFDIPEDSLCNKIEINSNSPFYDWLEAEIQEKHNYTCCETIEQFHRENYAITKEGQIKSGRIKHEKDDRISIFDRRNYILGWSNQDKIEAYEKDLENFQKSESTLDKEIAQLKTKQSTLGILQEKVRDFLKFRDFSAVNWKKIGIEIQELNKEKENLLNTSDEFLTLNKTLDETIQKIKSTDLSKSNLSKELGSIETNILKYANDLYNALDELKLIDAESISSLFQSQEAILKELDIFIKKAIEISVPDNIIKEQNYQMITDILEEKFLTINNIDRVARNVTDKISGKNGLIESKSFISNNLKRNAERKMDKFKLNYPAETNEVDSDIEARKDFKKIYQNLVDEDLLKHENKFKQLLKEGTIQGIALFNSQLEHYEKDIHKKIEEINKHLKDIEYNPGTYIKIIDDKVSSADISQFKTDLKNCYRNTIGETDPYNEEKYLQVKRILDRFMSREEIDVRWTEKVTDVRQWYSFGASERWLHDDVEKEYYSDSSGKSGGQKEKLAYTILASAIAFQFGLEWGETKSRSFRFVVIDEAFGRGSDESTRFGLKLFEKLNLQLLIVTPLQKINIIEDYINTVHFVSNPSGHNSFVRNLSKQELIKEREIHLAKAAHIQ